MVRNVSAHIGFAMVITIVEIIQTNKIANPVPHALGPLGGLTPPDALGDQEQLGDRNLKDHDPQVDI